MTCKDTAKPYGWVKPYIDAPIIRMTIDGKSFLGVLDTCSERSLAGRPLIRYLNHKGQETSQTTSADAKNLSRPGEELLKREEALVQMTWSKGEVRHRLVYVPELMAALILGRDFMKRTNIIVNISRNGWAFLENPGKVFTFEKESRNGSHLPNWAALKKELSPIREVMKEVVQVKLLVKVKIETKTEDWIKKEVEEGPIPDNNSQFEIKSVHASSKPFKLMVNEDLAMEVVRSVKGKAYLDEVNYIYDVLDDEKLAESVRAQLSRKAKALIMKYRQVNRVNLEEPSRGSRENHSRTEGEKFPESRLDDEIDKKKKKKEQGKFSLAEELKKTSRALNSGVEQPL